MVGGKPGYLRLLVMGSVAETQTASYAAEYLPHWQPGFFHLAPFFSCLEPIQPSSALL